MDLLRLIRHGPEECCGRGRAVGRRLSTRERALASWQRLRIIHVKDECQGSGEYPGLRSSDGPGSSSRWRRIANRLWRRPDARSVFQTRSGRTLSAAEQRRKRPRVWRSSRGPLDSHAQGLPNSDMSHKSTKTLDLPPAFLYTPSRFIVQALG